MIISIIAAVAEGGVIGYKNKLPWHIPEDLKRFKKITKRHHIVMGKKTYESVGKPLPDRINLVLSKDPKFKANRVKIARSIPEAISIAEKAGEKELMVVGGASIYKQYLPLTDTIYLTKIYHKFKGDTFFPRLSQREWKVIRKESRLKNDKNPYTFDFLVLKKKDK